MPSSFVAPQPAIVFYVFFLDMDLFHPLRKNPGPMPKEPGLDPGVVCLEAERYVKRCAENNLFETGMNNVHHGPSDPHRHRSPLHKGLFPQGERGLCTSAGHGDEG